MKNISAGRTGYTTGACAAAAAKGAAELAITGIPPESVTITLPAGVSASFPVFASKYGSTTSCSIKKFAGDDPDVTGGAIITATVEHSPAPGIELSAGEGVGIVTKPGLGLAIGSPAITATPDRMIRESVHSIAAGIDLNITISVLDGEKIALRTLNGRLGITGGISILGTSGIVYPLSLAAYTKTIEYAISVAAASRCETIVITTGRRTEKFAQTILKFENEAFVIAGDFIGHALSCAAANKIAKVILAVMPGKLLKLSRGDMQTHVSASSIDMEFLSRFAAGNGVRLPESVMSTAREAYENITTDKTRFDLFSALCREAAQRAAEHIGKQEKPPQIEVMMFNYNGEIEGTAATAPRPTEGATAPSLPLGATLGDNWEG